MQTSLPTLSSRARRWGAISLLAAAGLTALTPAQAHDELVSSDPAAQATLTEAPNSITLTYSGNITEVSGASQIRVEDAAGDIISQGDPRIEGKTVTQKISGHGTQDESYTVTWRVVSEDGHPIEGQYEWQVGKGSSEATVTTPAASTESPDSATEASDAASSALSSAKVGLFIAATVVVLGLIGAVIAKTRRPRS